MWSEGRKRSIGESRLRFKRVPFVRNDYLLFKLPSAVTILKQVYSSKKTPKFQALGSVDNNPSNC